MASGAGRGVRDINAGRDVVGLARVRDPLHIAEGDDGQGPSERFRLARIVHANQGQTRE